MHEPYYSIRELDFQAHHPCHPSPPDWRDQFIYFLMVDRFDDERDHPRYVPGAAPTGRRRGDANRFQGGTLRGITRRLDYIAGLGCTAIWISPILKNRRDLDGTYHGYGAQDLLAVDPRFGTLADLQGLTAAAHARGMYVILDIVINHTGDTWRYQDDPRNYSDGVVWPFGEFRVRDPAAGPQLDDAVWPIELQDPACFKRRGNITNRDDEAQIRDGDFYGMKELDINQPHVLNTLIKIYKYWLLAADLDGFRIDTVKHVESSAVAIFCNAIREYARELGKHNFFIFGEVMADDTTIQKYLGRNTRDERTHERFPSLDAVLDFPLAWALESAILGQAGTGDLRERYRRLHEDYADHGVAGEHFVTFIDNHDRHWRFRHGARHQDQVILAVAYLLTSQGVPCLYYGTEQGFDGHSVDHDNAFEYVREAMFGGTWGAFDTSGVQFFDPEHPLYVAIRAVGWVRAAQPALRYGRQYFREISGDGEQFGPAIDGDATLAYSRILDAEEILVAMNLAGHPRADYVTVDAALSPPGQVMRDLLHPTRTLFVEHRGGRACVRIELPAWGLVILKTTPPPAHV